jgi:hypothetical protein
VFYVVIMWFKERREKKRAAALTSPAPTLVTEPVS